MGDEIRDPRKTLPGAVAWGGMVSGLLYIGATLTLLVAIGKNEISVLQGIVQAVSHMAGKVGVAWIITPFAVMLSLSIAGIGSAWMGGSARIPFVAGLDSYMPSWLGKIHPKYRTPHAALIVQAVVSLILIVINFYASGGVQEAFQTMLSLAVVLQLVPFLYVFAALLKFAFRGDMAGGRYGRGTLINCIGVLSGEADYVGVEVRSEDVRIYIVFPCTGCVFLFRVRTAEGAARGRGRAEGRRWEEPGNGEIHVGQDSCAGELGRPSVT